MKKVEIKKVLSDGELMEWLEKAISALPSEMDKEAVIATTVKTLKSASGNRTLQENLQWAQQAPEEFQLRVPLGVEDEVSTTVRFKLMNPFKAKLEWEGFAQVEKIEIKEGFYTTYTVGVKVEKKTTKPMNWKGVDINSDYGDWLGD